MKDGLKEVTVNVGFGKYRDTHGVVHIENWLFKDNFDQLIEIEAKTIDK